MHVVSRYSQLAGVTFAVGVGLVVAGLARDAVAQAPSPPSNVQVLADDQPFEGATIYVSTAGADTNPGTLSNPVRTIQRGVVLANQANASGLASLVLVSAGVYREAVDLGTQKTDAQLIIQGTGGDTVLTGAVEWAGGWTVQADGSWVHDWPYKWGVKALPNGWDSYWSTITNADRDTLRRSEMVFANGAPLYPVLALSRLTTGKFYVDETAAKLYLRLPVGATLSTTTIEVGVELTPLRIVARRNVTLKNLAIARNRGAVQDVGVLISGSQNITFDSVTVQYLAYTAVGGNNNTTLRFVKSIFSDNGVNGMSHYRDVDILVEDSEIARNNWRGWAAGHKGWDSVFKWFSTRNGVVRHSRFTDNFGNGFWVDTDNASVTVANNLISGNLNRGVSLESNQGPIIITGNRICNNADAGVGDAQSDYVTLSNNQIFGNADWNVIFTGTYTGRTFTDWQTGQTYTAKSRYWTVTGNIIAGSGTGTSSVNAGWLWWHTDYNAPGAWAGTRNSFVAFDGNTWYHSDKTTPFTLPGGAQTFAQWKADLQLANPNFESSSTFSQANPALACTLP